jgi:predicted nucleic acid-binding protein
MTILVDLNVILDVVQRREPHYTDSAILLSTIVRGSADGAVPGHAITTVYYLVRRYVNKERAETTVDWLLNHLEVVPAGEDDFRTARQLEMDDFEDAVVATLADRASCDVIATRNTEDFGASPIPAKSPKAILSEFS